MCAFSTDTACIANEKYTTVVPIYGAGERLGTLIAATFNDPFVDDDLILAEYAATVVGIQFYETGLSASKMMQEKWPQFRSHWEHFHTLKWKRLCIYWAN